MSVKLPNKRLRNDVANFAKYYDDILAEIEKYNKHKDKKGLNNIKKHVLNGEANTALKLLVTAKSRKTAGLFFTSTALAKILAKQISPLIKKGIGIIDPACGAGNLLLSCIQYLPHGNTFDETIKLWSHLIKGYDLFPEFIHTASLRLAIAAASYDTKNPINIKKIQSKKLFKSLKIGDGLENKHFPVNSCLLVNPPFGHMIAPKNCSWGNGRIQTAGWFLDQLLQKATHGQHIIAILPDVLNSGTRYQKWREHICTMTSNISIKHAGRFDKDTDVDVFIFYCIVNKKGNYTVSWPDHVPKLGKNTKTLSDDYEIHVGTIVPHRDTNTGINYPYIHAKSATSWQTIDHLNETRYSENKAFNTPFVVVHRTSSPSDKCRCVASIVSVTGKVAVENHLLVLLPKDGSLNSCKKLLSSLRNPNTTKWVNKRIKCRHLTVSALRELPYFR